MHKNGSAEPLDSYTLLKFVLVLRALFFALGLISHGLLPDYDTSVIINYPVVNSTNSSKGVCYWAQNVAITWDRWDAVHFVDIAIHGYRFEHNFAFYPLLPLALRAASPLVSYLLYFFQCLSGSCSEFCDSRTAMVLSGLVISHTASVLSVLKLHHLSLLVLENRALADSSAILYAIQPALTFTLAPYTESLFAYLSFSGLHLLATGRPFLAAMMFALCAGTRSNGILYCGFLVHYAMTSVPCFPLSNSESSSSENSNHRALKLVLAVTAWVHWAVRLAAQISIALCLHWAFGLYGAATFCPSTRQWPILPTFSLSALLGLEQDISNNVSLLPRPWCRSGPSLLGSNLYSFVQVRDVLARSTHPSTLVWFAYHWSGPQLVGPAPFFSDSSIARPVTCCLE